METEMVTKEPYLTPGPDSLRNAAAQDYV